MTAIADPELMPSAGVRIAPTWARTLGGLATVVAGGDALVVVGAEAGPVVAGGPSLALTVLTGGPPIAVVLLEPLVLLELLAVPLLDGAGA